MLFFHLTAVAAILGGASAEWAPSETPTPTSTQVERRAETTENASVPTFILRPIKDYLVKDDKNPEPEKDALQMYPRGIYDDFPKEGVTMAFGPDLKKRIIDAMGNDCAANREACRDRLMPIIHSTDIQKHSKRFVLVLSAFLVATIVQITVEVLIAAAAAGIAYEVAHSVKYEHSDLHQMEAMGQSGTYAIQPGSSAKPTTITPPKMAPLPQPTGQGDITFETLTADIGDWKAGDVVYHIPVDNARIIQDYMKVIGLQQVMDTCKGYKILEPNINPLTGSTASRVRRQHSSISTGGIQNCLNMIRDFVPRLIEGVPLSAIKVAQPNVPLLPGPGQPINYPFPKVSLPGSTESLASAIYRNTISHMQPRPDWKPEILSRTEIDAQVLSEVALGEILMDEAIAHDGRIALDVRVKLATMTRTLTEEEFKCPKDILCLKLDCLGQIEGYPVEKRNAFCKANRYYGCPCRRVHYLDDTPSDKGWLDSQYSLMEKLIEENNIPDFERKCSGFVACRPT